MSTRARGQPRPRISPLQTKGMLTLGLLLIAESITVSNAVKVWSATNERMEKVSFATTAKKDACFDSSLDTCSASSTLAPKNRRSFGKWARRLSCGSIDCCVDCSHCTVKALETCRGGHGGVGDGVAETVADAASRVLPYNIPLNGWKVIFQAFLTTLNVICWLIPLRSKKMSENKLALSLANAFSGGVFLSLAFGHLIPECVHGFEGFNEVTPYLLVLSGYLLIFFVEKVAFDAHEIMHEMEHAQDHKVNGGGAGEGETNGVSSGRSAVILLGALAVHSVLEMTALGLANSFGDSAILTLSIALHQPAESIALLVAFLKSGMPKGQIIRYLSVFSAMGPIGVALGMAVNEFAAPIVDSVMIAVVAGTFLYVGATEVIPEEWEDSQHKWKKFVALMGGIVSILIITQYTSKLEL
mmetsp:Transcript_85654/g.247296  ORF Transcript_85654/g.247296 Transcript_85654/m.247296 type:complete len:414 (+) Transcript_85654:116-1357(+)